MKAAVAIPDIELGAELGRGAHSIVLRGSRAGQSYAVKLPLNRGTDVERQAYYRRFLREAVALARIRHPSLPSVMEVGRANDVPYLVMDLATGETLAERLRRGPMAQAEVTSLALAVGGALAAIHAAGLVHRDVKPQNIVFDASLGTARLVDLGSATLAGFNSVPLGTRAYAAPEVLSGEGLADPRSDLFSLGRVLLEALGHGSQRVAVEPGLPAEASVPGEFGAILSRLVASRLEARFPTARHFCDAIGIIASGSPPARVPVRSHLFGRDAELDRMRRALADAHRGGRVLLVQGEPGTGKTRLVEGFVEEARGAGTTVLTAGCHPRDPRAFSAVRQLVEGYLRHVDTLSGAVRARAISEMRKLAGDFGSLLKLLSPAVASVFHDVPNVPLSENAEQGFAEGLAEFLGRLLRRVGPIVVVVDDTQWLDPGSRRVLARSIELSKTGRVLFVLSVRSGMEPMPLPAMNAAAVRIDLATLSGEQVIQLASDYLSAGELDVEVQRTVLRLSNGTPLHVLEVLRTLLDEGVLLPHWGRWRLNSTALQRMHLPTETTSLLRRRIDALDPMTRAVLSVASVAGMSFEEGLVVRACDLDVAAVGMGLAEARHAQLIEADGEGRHRFIHHTVRDTLIGSCSPNEVSETHQRVAEALDVATASSSLVFGIEEDAAPWHLANEPSLRLNGTVASDADFLYRVAHHYSLGVSGRSPGRVAETGLLAAKAAFARFDNAQAVDFFEGAERALGTQGKALGVSDRLLLAEARLRLGMLDDALVEFRRALADARDPYQEVAALTRMAFVHETRLDTVRAWETLVEAFARLGEEAPQEQTRYVLGSVVTWASRRVPRPRRPRGTASDRLRDETLCFLYFEASRIAHSSGKPARLALSVLRALGPAERLGPSAALAKSYLAYAFLLTVVGLPRAGATYLAEVEEIARDQGDPAVTAHALQMHMMIASWGGRMHDALAAGGRCLLEYGHWRELSEFCSVAFSLYHIEAARGRSLEAWKWLDLTIQRVNRHEGKAVLAEFLLQCARGALAALGREADQGFLHRLEQASVAVPPDSGSYSWTFAARVQLFTEPMALGPSFDAIVNEFRASKQDPKRANLIVFTYYIHVAHARANECLAAAPTDRTPLLVPLSAALEDLRAASRIPLFNAHAIVVDAYYHWFQGKVKEADHLFDAAARLGAEETAPWVLYAVHRGRAHMLRAQGRHDAAHDQAVLAESLATDHGAVHRARWVREEFDLRPRRSIDGSGASSPSDLRSLSRSDTTGLLPGGSRARRQLRALLRISQARAPDLDPDHQARLVVDELVQALRAQRGFLFLESRVTPQAQLPAPPVGSALADVSEAGFHLVAGRDTAGRDLGAPTDHDAMTVKRALVLGTVPESEPVQARCATGTTARLAAIATPLVVDDVPAGLVYLDRPLAEGVFTDADGEVLAALAGQVSVALELARALHTRERAQEETLSAQKMDAVARLAGGIAHDLNNMLSSIRYATATMLVGVNEVDPISEDVKIIQTAEQHAAALTRQLLAFSRGEFGKPEPVLANARIERLLSVFQGLVGASVTVESKLAPGVGAVLIDPDQLDQVLMNLVVNARDALPEGGRVLVETAEVELDAEYVRRHPRVKVGRYVRLSVADNGHGMPPDVLQKVFEPYFTTKGERGTGLGLASVYWIAQHSGGHVDVESTVGVGTVFTLYFPRVDAVESSRPGRSVPPASARPAGSRETVLVVQDDSATLRYFEETLAGLGYRVLVARTEAQASDLVRRRGVEIDLVIADVLLPGMNGLELGRELRKSRPGLAVLYVAADTGGILADRGISGERVEFLPRVVAAEVLARRVREALDRRGATR